MEPVKIKLDGIELEVDPSSVAVVMTQLLQVKQTQAALARAILQPSPPPTPPVASAAPPVKLDQQGSWPVPTPKPPAPPAQMPLGDLKRPSTTDAPLTLRFLRAIQVAPSQGLDGDAIGKVLNVTHPKGIGSRTAIINNTIVARGFDRASVYVKFRDATGARWWRPGPRITEVIGTLEKEGIT